MKKCMPITRPSLPVALASSVIEMEEVLEDRIVSGGRRESSSPKIFFLTPTSSVKW